jgi:hypothetical protein
MDIQCPFPASEDVTLKGRVTRLKTFDEIRRQVSCGKNEEKQQANKGEDCGCPPPPQSKKDKRNNAREEYNVERIDLPLEHIDEDAGFQL